MHMPNKKPKKNNKSNKPKKPSGHYCWACGQHKAHEKFSGKGHANHICKSCKAMPVAERNKMVAVRKAENMAFRYLCEQEIKWLRKKMKDPRPEVRQAAQNTYRVKFPRQERNMIKKGLTAFSLELLIHGEIWDEYGDEISINVFVTMERDGTIRRTDYNAPDVRREEKVVIGEKEARAFLKSVIHEYDALFWHEDFCDGEDSDFDEDDDGFDDEDENDETEPSEPKEPIFSLLLELNNGTDKKINFYNQIPDSADELFWDLMEFFEADEESEEILQG